MKHKKLRRAGVLALIVGLAACSSIRELAACTIFVLTDSKKTLFLNNEDYSNPNTRVWFVPGGTNYFGAAYLGFDDGTPQGGMNTEGLAYDWVAGFDQKGYKPAPEMIYPRGFSAARMLETCRTVEEAIQFYQKHAEPSFENARVMIADRSGASVIIGAKEGKLEFVRSRQCRGFGYGQEVVNRRLNSPPKTTVANGLKILREARQEGQFATKYANIFDLKSGDIYIYPDPSQTTFRKFNLREELEGEGYYHEIPALTKRGKPARYALKPEMRRFYLDQFSPVSEPDQALNQRLLRVLSDAGAGAPKQEDYSPAFWSQLPPGPELKKQIGQLGAVEGLVEVNPLKEQLVGAGKAYDFKPSNLRRFFIVDYEKARVLQLFRFDAENRITTTQSELVEIKPGRKLD